MTKTDMTPVFEEIKRAQEPKTLVDAIIDEKKAQVPATPPPPMERPMEVIAKEQAKRESPEIVSDTIASAGKIPQIK